MPTDSRRSNTDTDQLLSRKAVRRRLNEDKTLIEQFRRDSELRKKAMITRSEMRELSAAIGRARRLYGASFRGGSKQSALVEKAGPDIRSAVRKHVLSQVQGARKVARLNRANIMQLDALFCRTDKKVVNAGLDIDVVVATEELLEYEEFRSPYDFSEVSTPNEAFEHDGSYAIHDWGAFGNDIEFVHKHSHADIGLSFETSEKYAFTTAGVGKAYKLPRKGPLDITVIVRNLSNAITFENSDYLGPSTSYLDFENIFFLAVSGQSAGHIHSEYVMDESRHSSGSLSTVQPGQLFVLNIRTEDTFEQDEDVRILLVSYVRVLSYAYLVQHEVSANLSWHLERMFVKVS